MSVVASTANHNSATYGTLEIARSNMNADGAGANLHFMTKEFSGALKEMGGIGATIDAGLTADVAENGSLHFYTTSGGSTRQERMVIKSGGYVGIGTTNPGDALHIEGGTSWNGLRITRNGDSAGNEFRILHYGGPGSGTQILQNGNLPLRFITGGSETVRINGNGSVGIGTASPLGGVGDLTLGNSSGSRGDLYLYGSTAGKVSQLFTTNGNLHIDSDDAEHIYLNWYGGLSTRIGNGSAGYGPIYASAFNVSSSKRFKKNISNNTYGLSEILRLSTKRYKYINDPTEKEHIGLIAEEVVNVIPEVVAHGGDGEVDAIDYTKLTVVLIEGMKAQQQQINQLKAKLEKLQ